MSDFTDKVDDDRRKVIHYNTFIASSKEELKGYEGRKKEIVLEGVKILESRGYDKEKISEKLGDDLEGYISRQYVRKVLGDEYKQKSKSRDQAQSETNLEILCATVAQKIPQEDNSKKLLVMADGQTIAQEQEHPDEEISPVDPIYGKSKEQMRLEAEANREIKEDREETLENPANTSIPKIPLPLISDTPAEVREIKAKLEEQDLLIAQIIEDRDHAIREQAKYQKQFNLLKGGSMSEENQRLKVENNNLRTLMADVDKEYLEKEGYKEIEVLKLYPETIRLLNEVSSKSQKTFFLLVHPKTMQIKGAKTDVEMHIIQAKRNRGIPT